jgi:DNA-binding PadR family transcriptional regulator
MLPSKSLRHAILANLQNAPMHGYRLRQLAHRYSWIYPITNAPIYPVLHDLEEEGLLSHHTEIHRGRVRKIYSLTPGGEQELNSWLTTSPDDELAFSDPVAFKVAAHNDGALARSTAWMRESLARMQQKIDEQLQELAKAGDLSEYTRLAVEYGIDMLRLRIRLVEQTLELAESKRTGASIHPMLQSVCAP